MALSPYTFNNLPAVRPLPKPRSWPAWVYDRRMEQARAMYAAYNTPMRAYPGPDSLVKDLKAGRLLWERERERKTRVQRLVAASRLNKKNITDTPRIPPFKGECFKRAWTAFKLWRSKRQAWHELDWFNRHPL